MKETKHTLITPENYDQIIKDQGLFTFQALIKPIPVQMFEAKEIMLIEREEKGENGEHLLYHVDKGDIIARYQDGRVRALSRDYVENNYDPMPLQENEDGTVTANWASKRD